MIWTSQVGASPDAVPHPTQPSMFCTPQQPKMGMSEAWPGSSRSCWGSQKALDIHWHGKSSMHEPGRCGRLRAGARHACLHGAEPWQVGKRLARSFGRGFLQAEGLSRGAKPPLFGCRQRKDDNCPPQEMKPLESRFCAAVSQGTGSELGPHAGLDYVPWGQVRVQRQTWHWCPAGGERREAGKGSLLPWGCHTGSEP